jgi:hypothetical protein
LTERTFNGLEVFFLLVAFLMGEDCWSGGPMSETADKFMELDESCLDRSAGFAADVALSGAEISALDDNI